MFRRLLEMIKQALRQMVKYKDIEDAVASTTTVSDDMVNSIQLWKDIYRECAPWLNSEAGVYGLNIAKDICSQLAVLVTSEANSEIVPAGGTTTALEGGQVYYMDKVYANRVKTRLRAELEKAMAVGGMIIKPYVANNEIYFDFCRQGEFYPIRFDDDGNITDIAFIDQFTAGENVYTRVERHTFSQSAQAITIENKAYKAKQRDKNEGAQQELGNEVELKAVDRWASIEPSVVLEGISKPLYGYYRVPIANTVEFDAPLGASVFAPAVTLIQRADMQYSRLDWEYDGGQLAIDVDITAIRPASSKWGQAVQSQDRFTNRLYRKLDLGTEDTYNAFTPALRDSNYLQGLNRYLSRIEDLVGLARGSLSEASVEDKTATEVKMSKQKSFVTVADNQKALEKCLRDAIDAMSAYIRLYNIVPAENYDVIMEWSDSVLTDTDTELTQKLALKEAGIISSAEVRAWYLGEPIEVAEAEVAKLEKAKTDALMGDVFSAQQEQTLEE